MFCPKCGKEISPDEQFCWNCGTENKRFVSQMQAAEKPGASEKDGRYLQEQDRNVLAQELQKTEPEGVSSDSASHDYRSLLSDSASSNYESLPSDSVSYDYRSLPSEKESGLKSFYIFDFLSGLTGKSSIPLCIFLVLNVLIIGIICSLFLTLPIPWGLLSGVLLYGASVTVALSPIGEFIIRNQNNCREIMDVATVNRLKPIFDEVYYKAKKKNPKISGDVRLFMNDDEAPNAFATGRKTVCITRGLLDYDDETIKSILAHEFGHLSHKDTDRILVVAIGNVVITGITTLFQIGVIFFHCIMSIVALFMDAEDGFWVSVFSAFASFLSLIFVRGIMKVWTALGVALCMKTSRSNEYEADEFAFSLGYGESLCAFLSNLSDARPQGLFASLASSHPEPTDRVERLLQLAQEKVLLEVE